MDASESLQALHRANPRADESFCETLDAAAAAVHARIAGAPAVRPRRRRLPRVSAAGAAVVVVAATALVTLTSVGGGPGTGDAAAAVREAVGLSAATAERSGTAVLRITRNGELWTGMTIGWNGDDLVVRNDAPDREGRVDTKWLVVDGTLYGVEDGRWLALGSPDNIDPDSGTTPDEYLSAVRDDVGGATVRRIGDAMTGVTAGRMDDGTEVYRGKVAAGVIARETGFKEGDSIRVFPFGAVAQGEAADPDAELDAAVTVGADGILRKITITWGEPPSAWTYAVAYSDLGATAAPVAPANAPSIMELRERAAHK